MACMAALTSLSTTVGTGIIAGGAVTCVFIAPEAAAESKWSPTDKITTDASDTVGFYADPNTGTPIEVNKADITDESLRNRPIVQIAPETDQQTTNVNVTLYNGDTLRVIQNPWTVQIRNYGLLSVKQLTVGGGATSDVVNIDVDADQGAEIINVAGSIGTIVNDGVLALGSSSAASSINIGGAVTNNGTLTLRGTLVNTGSLTLGGTVEISKEWGALAGYSEGANGYIGYAGGEITVIQGGYSGDVTFVRDGETVTLTEGKLQVDAYTDSTVYYLNSGTGTATKTKTFTPTGVVVQESGSAIELVGLKDADLTDKVAVNVNSTLVIGDGSDLTDAVVQKGCDTLSLTVNKGGKFTINSGDNASTPYNGDITVNGGGVLLLNTVDTLGWGNFGGTIPSSINLKGSDGSLAKLQMTARTTMSSPINMQGYAVIENPTGAELAQHAGLDGYQFTVKATGTNNVISCPVMGTAYEGDVIVNVEGESDSLEITGKIYNRNGVIDFTKQGAGTLLLSNAESVVDGMFTMEGGVTQVTENLKLSGGLTMLATAGATIGGDATVTVSGGTITLAAANNFGAGTLHFENIITLDVSAFTDFDPTVAGAQLTLGQVGKLTMADNVSLLLTTPIDNSLAPVISLDDSGNIVLTIQPKALSWNTTETAAILNTNGLSVTVNYQDGQYVAVYEGGTAVSTPIADGTGQIQVMPTKVMLSDSATISLESGTYAGVSFMQVGGDLHGTLGSATDQKKLTLNITGDASVTNFIGGGQGVLGWCNVNADVSLYSDIEFNVNTTGTVAGIVLTGEDNSGSKIKVYGDITANIEAGTIKAVMNGGNVYDSNTGAALAAGSKGMYIEGDITYNLGNVGNDDSALVIEGNVVGTISQMNGGAKGASVGDVVINVNSGTYQSIYGTGNTTAHTGNVTINYNGGIINGVFKGSAGATVSGDKVLNMAASLDASKVDLSTFTAVNVLGESVLSVTTGGYAYDSQKVVFDSTATLFVDENGGVVCADQLVVDGNLTINGSVDITGTVDAEGAKYSDNNTDGYLVSQKTLVSADGDLVIGDNAAFSFNGAALDEYTVNQGTVTAGVVDKSVYYVNSADYEYSATKIDTTCEIQIAAEGSLVVKTSGNQLGAINGEGTLVVAPGTTATLAEVIGTGNAIGCPVVEISGENTDLTIDNRLDSKVVVIDGATVQSGGAYFAKDVTLDNKAVMVASGQTELFNWGQNQKISILNDSELQLGNVRISLEGTDELVLNNGKITGAGDGSAAVDICKTAIKVSSQGTSSISGPIRITGGQTANLNVIDGTLTVGEVKGRGNSYLSKTGTGVLELNGNLDNLSGVTINQGTLSVGATGSFGSSTVTIGANASLALGTTAMTMADATLALKNGSILSMAALSADATPLTLKAITLDTAAGSVYIDAKAEDLVPGTYNIIAGTGLDISKFALYGAAAGKYSTIFSVDENNVLKMTLAVNDKALYWTGDTEDNVWSGTADNTPWEKVDGTAVAFADSAIVNFTTDTPAEERAVTISGTVAPAGAYVTGEGWEWSGDGAINSTGSLVIGDGTATSLTIANTGAKTFTGGVLVDEGATLVIENVLNWTGKVSGQGTLELAHTGLFTLNGNSGIIYTLIDSTANGARLGCLRLSNGIILNGNGSNGNQTCFSNIDKVQVVDGACFATSAPLFAEGSKTVMHIAGDGIGAEAAGSDIWKASAISLGNLFAADNKAVTLHSAVVLDDDATVYVGSSTNEHSIDGIFGSTFTFQGNTLTKIGTGRMAVCYALTDAFDFNIAQGTLLFDGSAVTGTGSATIADGATFQIKGRTGGNWKEITLTEVTMFGGSTLNLYDYQDQKIGQLSMSGGAKVIFDGSSNANAAAADIDVLSVSEATDVAASIVIACPNTSNKTINIHSVTGSGTIELTRDNETRGNTQLVVLDGANEFSGNWHVTMFNTLKVTHEDALANATVELDYRSADNADREAMLQLGCETVKIKGLQGNTGEVTMAAPATYELQFNTAGGDYSYGGNFDVADFVDIVKNGAGSQSFTNTTNFNFAGNITVNEGTLNLSTAQSSAGREISIAGGATLGTALTLNGGTLSLDTTATTAASLGNHSLTLSVGTTLNLTLAGTEVTGAQITLLGGISDMKNVILGENGALGLLGDCFTLGVITDKSVSADTPALTDATGVDAWADRLGRSELFYDEVNDLLYITLASNILAADPLYWDPADAAGNGSWLGTNWSEEDKLGVDPGVMQNPWQGDKPVSVVFDGDTAAEVTIDTDAVVTDLTVKNGVYTYVKDGETGTLTIEGKLTVEGTGTADITAMGAVTAGSLDVDGTLTADDLTVNGAAAVDGSVTADTLTITGDATVDGGTVGATTLGAGSLTASNGATVNATNIVIGGKAEITGSTVDAAGLLSAAEVVISGDAAVVEAAQLKVGEGGLSMSAGTLNAGSLFSNDGVTAKAEITGGTVTIGGSTLSSTTVTGAEFVGESTLAGAADKAVTVGNITVDGAAELEVSNATLTGQITVEDGGTLALNGDMYLDTSASDFGLENKSTYAATADASDLGKEIADGGNGFVSRNEIYTVVTGSLTDVTSSDSTWTVGADAREGEYANGKVTISESKDTTAYWVNSNVTLSNVSGNFVEDTATIKLNGGMLQMNENTDLAIATNNENPNGTESTIALQNGVTLDAEKLTIADGTTVVLRGQTGTTLDLGTEAGVDSALKGLGDDTWMGKVTTAATDITDVAALGNAASEVELTGAVDSGVIALGDVGKVHATDSLTAESISGTGALEVDGLTTLKKGTSSLGDAAFDGGLVLGGDEAAALTGADLTAASVELAKGSIEADTLIVGGALTINDGSLNVAGLEVEGTTTVGGAAKSSIIVDGDAYMTGGVELGKGSSLDVEGALVLDGSAIKYNDLDSKVTAGTYDDEKLALVVDTEQLKDAVDAGKDVTLFTLTEGTSEAAISLNGGSNVLSAFGEKYSYSLDWDDAGQNVTLDSVANANYMKEKYSEGSANAKAGATIMDDAFAAGATNADGDLKKILAAVDNGAMTEDGLASVAGSSTAALGMAFAGDVDRQLRAIRNRTTTMGVNQCVVNEGMPYFNAWVNAEGNLGELDKDGTFAGYQLDSWGGTIGFDVDVNPNLTLGLAVTAMYGDLTVDGPDKLDGDLDTMYVSAFARYSARAWTHTFVGTVGMMDSSYKRTVSYGQGESYKTEGDTDGMAFGLMYEVGRVIALTESGSACLQPVFNVAYRHTSVGGYNEKGGDAALKVDDQTLDTVTFGAGARMQAVVGENLYNRTSLLELRALAKLDVGDRSSEADVAFIGGGRKATVESAELGAFGVELGAGLSIPMGDEDSGTLFFDVSAELRSGYTNLNGTVGYRINF